MRNLLSTTAIILTLTFSGTAFAYQAHDDDEGIYGEYISSRLPADEAADFRDTMKDAQDENESYAPQVNQLHQDLHRILTAPRFNSDAFIEKSNELRDIHEKMGANWTAAFTTAVRDLPQQDRIKIAESMGKGHKSHHHWFKKSQ